MTADPQYAAARRNVLRTGPALRARPAVIAIVAAALVVAAPVIFVLSSLFAGAAENQLHIWSTSGPRYLLGTILLCLLTGAGVSAIGAGTAILTAMTDFPGRRALSVALVLPFAVPAYISAYAYADLLGPFGAVAHLLGGPGSEGARLAPEIRTLPGAAFILTLSAYAYVYLAMRASLAGRSGALLEAARTLGASPAGAVWRVLLPAGRAAFAGGLALALMETAADFGVADYFGVATLSVGIFRTWYGLGDLAAASQLAAGLFVIAVLLTLIEERGRRAGAEGTRGGREQTRLKLRGGAALLAFLFCATPVLLGFVAPVAVLAAKAGGPLAPGAARAMLGAAANTGLIAGGGAALAIALATILAYAARRARSAPARLAIRVATIGYAIPGAVLAVGVLYVAHALRLPVGAAWAGIGLLLYAYVARFLTAGYNSVAGGLSQIHPSTDGAARNLGAGAAGVVLRVHWPLARRAFAAGALIVLIDIAKELPATLILRPFNFETLATRIYRLASDERLADAAPAALLLVALSIIPAVWLEAAARRRSTPLQRERSADSTASQIKWTSSGVR